MGCFIVGAYSSSSVMSSCRRYRRVNHAPPSLLTSLCVVVIDVLFHSSSSTTPLSYHRHLLSIHSFSGRCRRCVYRHHRRFMFSPSDIVVVDVMFIVAIDVVYVFVIVVVNMPSSSMLSTSFTTLSSSRRPCYRCMTFISPFFFRSVPISIIIIVIIVGGVLYGGNGRSPVFPEKGATFYIVSNENNENKKGQRR